MVVSRPAPGAAMKAAATRRDLTTERHRQAHRDAVKAVNPRPSSIRSSSMPMSFPCETAYRVGLARVCAFAVAKIPAGESTTFLPTTIHAITARASVRRAGSALGKPGYFIDTGPASRRTTRTRPARRSRAAPSPRRARRCRRRSWFGAARRSPGEKKPPRKMSRVLRRLGGIASMMPAARWGRNRDACPTRHFGACSFRSFRRSRLPNRTSIRPLSRARSDGNGPPRAS
jgi:hypothetical protein